MSNPFLFDADGPLPSAEKGVIAPKEIYALSAVLAEET
jgi:hypothetical protein